MAKEHYIALLSNCAVKRIVQALGLNSLQLIADFWAKGESSLLITQKNLLVV